MAAGRVGSVSSTVAIGAQPAGIVRLFSRETLRVAIAGIALGLCSYAVAGVWLVVIVSMFTGSAVAPLLTAALLLSPLKVATQ